MWDKKKLLNKTRGIWVETKGEESSSQCRLVHYRQGFVDKELCDTKGIQENTYMIREDHDIFLAYIEDLLGKMCHTV